MKRRCTAIVMVLGLCGTVLGMNYLGPPTTRMRAGQWSIGASYMDSEQDVEFDTEIDFDDLEESSVLGRVGVGLATERAEIFGLFGMAELEQDSFETDEELILGGGFRVTMYRDEQTDLDWGIVGQFLYLKTDDTSVVLGTYTDYELSLAEIEFGLGPCWRPGWGLLYGGALIHWIDGNMDTAARGDFDVNQDSLFGIYIGGGVEIAERWTLTAEAQATPDAFGWAVATQLRF